MCENRRRSHSFPSRTHRVRGGKRIPPSPSAPRTSIENISLSLRRGDNFADTLFFSSLVFFALVTFASSALCQSVLIYPVYAAKSGSAEEEQVGRREMSRKYVSISNVDARDGERPFAACRPDANIERYSVRTINVNRVYTYVTTTRRPSPFLFAGIFAGGAYARTKISHEERVPG